MAVDCAPFHSFNNSVAESYDGDACLLGEQSQFCLKTEIGRLQSLVQLLNDSESWEDKMAILGTDERLQRFEGCCRDSQLHNALMSLNAEEQYVIKCLPVLGQAHVLCSNDPDINFEENLRKLAGNLLRVETFYNSMGGVVGYQLESLQLILAAEAEQHQSDDAEKAVQITYHKPPGLDLSGEGGSEPGKQAAANGLKALPFMAEIYPVGGAGDRLGLCCEKTGEALPAALLPYCGHSMISMLLRDLQAREYLYYRLTGVQVTTPVAIMTSDAKGNHSRMCGVMEHNQWFGRGPQAFKLFRQPLVPVMAAEDGRWLLSGPGRPMMKPGGHGAIWKLMMDEGVFDWLRARGRSAAIVRQISNPMAGMDTTLLALAGVGWTGRKDFGFMSCERVVGAAEGMNVLQERKVWDASRGAHTYEYGVTNVEYTEFERLGVSDVAAEGSEHSVFPANTNILYVGLAAVRAAVEAAMRAGGRNLMPGLIFNLKKKVRYTDPVTRVEREVTAGRMESTMQNLADVLVDGRDVPLTHADVDGAAAALRTFMVYNLRRKVTSSAKKRRQAGSTRIHQTPDGSFYDLMRNGWHLLQRCGMKYLPEMSDVARYLERGPGFVFLFHPALGPLWDVVEQKIRGGALRPGGEMVLEVAEARLVDLTVDGSLQVHAENVMGHMEITGGEGRYSSLYDARRAGRASPPSRTLTISHPDGRETLLDLSDFGASANANGNSHPLDAAARAAAAANGFPGPEYSPFPNGHSNGLHGNANSQHGNSQHGSGNGHSNGNANVHYMNGSGSGQYANGDASSLRTSGAYGNGQYANGAGHLATTNGNGRRSHANGNGSGQQRFGSASGDGIGASVAAAGGTNDDAPADMSSDPSPRLRYSSSAGRVLMHDVTIRNAGVDWRHPDNVYWRHQLQRFEGCRILLRGRSEFEAVGVDIVGDVTFEVPDGYRMVLYPRSQGRGYNQVLLPLEGDAPSWEWVYSAAPGGRVRLDFRRNSGEPVVELKKELQGFEDGFLDYII